MPVCCQWSDMLELKRGGNELDTQARRTLTERSTETQQASFDRSRSIARPMLSAGCTTSKLICHAVPTSTRASARSPSAHTQTDGCELNTGVRALENSRTPTSAPISSPTSATCHSLPSPELTSRDSYLGSTARASVQRPSKPSTVDLSQSWNRRRMTESSSAPPL